MTETPNFSVVPASMSKRNEIKEKEQLRLQIQAQFNKIDETVLSWLKPTPQLSTANTSTDNEFANQIVIPNGKGINFDDSIKDEKKVTISDFLQDENLDKRKKEGLDKVKKVGDLKKSGVGNSSNSLRALTNKLRKDRRGDFEMKKALKSSIAEKIKGDKKIYKANDDDEEDSEDEEDEILKRKSKGKNDVMGKGKNKRPF